jgi:trehalose-phosphatase
VTGPDAAPRLLGGRELVALALPRVRSGRLLIVSDFDGTLARIVMDPWGATIVPEARRALRRLAGTPGVHVALLSGRTALDLASRARVGGAVYLGNHGVERGVLARGRRAETLHVERDPALESYVEDVQLLAERVARDVPETWMVVERKGPSVAFHFRAAPDLAVARERLLAAVERADTSGRLVRFPGTRALEVRPPGAVAKRDALRLLIDELRPATTLVLGDDAADADAFMVLRELRDAAVTDGLAVAVHAHAEMPEPVAAAADVALASPVETARFLAGLARAVRAARQAVTAPPRAASSAAHARARVSSPSSNGPSRPAT